MKKHIQILLGLLLSSSLLWAQKDYKVQFEQPIQDSYQLIFNVENWNLEDIHRDGNDYKQINFSSSTFTQDKGYAELPFISASIQLPSLKNVDMNIISSEYEEIILDRPLLPSPGVIYRNQDPATISYQIAEESLKNCFYPDKLAFAEEPFIVRDVRGTSVRVFPFAWNAVTKTLRIYTRIEIELKENQENPINPLLKENPAPVKEAVGIYKSMFLNYNQFRQELVTPEFGDILVVTTARDEEAIEPYIVWKKEKGFNVSKVVVDKGENVKALIQQQYNQNNQLIYVLLVGDWGDIRSDYESFTTTVGPTDPALGCVVGDDLFPDLAIGRFSANNAGQVAIQVNKTIEYEKNPNMDPDWRETFIGIGSNDMVPGDDGEKDYEHIQRIYTQRLESFDYTTHQENYAPLANINTLIEHINTGASTIAYCGHGTSSYFVTTGLNNTDVLALNNNKKLPFIVAVACSTGAFHSSNDCFGETWLRKENGGAIIAWMSSVEQPWSPPQRGQDYFYDILTGGFDYTLYENQNGINTSEQRTFWGSLAINSMGLMLCESSRTDDIMTVKTWITFGDPSLQLRTKTPNEIISSNEKVVAGVNFETIITSNGVPVENAMVCISQDGVYAKGITDVNGKVSIDHSFVPGNVLLVVTAFNAKTVYKEILSISPEGSYVVVDEVVVNDDNQQLDYSDGSVKLNMTLENVGNDSAQDVKVTIYSEDPCLNIINGTAIFTTVPSNDKITLENAFEISIDKNVPDRHPILIKAVVEGNETWINDFYLTANSFDLSIADIFINDIKNDYLKSNETAIVKFTLINQGHSDAKSLTVSFSTESFHLNLPIPSKIELGNIAIGGSHEVELIITIPGNIPFGYDAEINLLLTAGNGTVKELPLRLSTFSYCTPSFQDCSDDDKLTSFILEDIINTDETCTDTGYSDYTYLSTILEPGVEYTAKAKFGYSNERAKGWIDYNGNGIFEDEEALFIIRGAKADTEVSQTFILPEEAVPGTHVMRVRVKYQTIPTDPCTDESIKGQTHDYTIIVPEKYSKVQNLTVAPDENKIMLAWETSNIDNQVLLGYRIMRNNTLLTDNHTVTNFEDANVNIGNVYVYEVYAVYEAGISLPAITDIIVYTGQVGLPEVKTKTLFTVYPNPVSDVLNIQGESMPKKVSLYNMAMQMIYTTTQCDEKMSLPVYTLAIGIYLLMIETENDIIIKKFIKR